jgi:hypothetical protein
MTKPRKGKAALAGTVPRKPVTKRCGKNGLFAVLLRYPRGEAPLERGIIHWK